MAGEMRWSPDPKVEQLEDLARNMVGDDKDPNVFFVSVKGHIVVVSLDFTVAYRAWKAYASPPTQESALEDRKTGVIASVEPEEDGSDHLVVYDSSVEFGYR